MTKLTVTFRNFANAPKNASLRTTTDHVKTEVKAIRETPRLLNKSLHTINVKHNIRSPIVKQPV
jgi:hypothetical protein